MSHLTARRWLHGLVSTLINGAASAVVLIVVDPLAFNFAEGRCKLASASLACGLIGIANYLQKAPLPDIGDE